jgi:Damage-control phosphatase ARMT1-like domain
MPHLPIPPLLRGTEAGSFAEDTIVRRLPAIALRVISENSFDEPTNQRLRALAHDLPRGRVRPLLDVRAQDWSSWQNVLQPFLGQTWLELPLFAAEMVFYRRILEATGYFQPGSGYGVDPYRLQKTLGLTQAGPAIAQALPQGLTANGEALRRLIHLSLWGNQADLSLWPVQGEGGGKAQGGGHETHLAADQNAAALAQMEALDSGRVDLLLDNFGVELIFDLLLAHALLVQNARLSVHLHVKPHPCFVSDAIPDDVKQALRWLKRDAPAWARPAAEQLEQAEQAGRMQVETHFYWASPSPAWEAPPDLWADLGRSAFIISKGDINYRRWLGDARWPPATSLEAIIDPPAPLLLLRVLKSDIVAGLKPGQAGQIFAGDPAWQVNGQWGLIQFVK